ncbi:hypothetical protein MBM_07470 [Drepanopeziza brunnea f. sp. 'multigermtubi' MB_m1]|uniref:Uncharacterized protein n=1 Tax=Marssonina brunnea f. sp. multigermtubi (strain MB_m1) TaxID=1072389 RepID=K1WAF9_MARBU|nr:uncharacterized protein MBM_07470 [Drepanopeziza brunnea f. sp. 'multigermtubi' MB_m1]EKD14240.1 hypothetical protein MBM_07470 [Drepanopeziza brunnea f. sp. 'multigermtubi' MB_m1]
MASPTGDPEVDALVQKTDEIVDGSALNYLQALHADLFPRQHQELGLAFQNFARLRSEVVQKDELIKQLTIERDDAKEDQKASQWQTSVYTFAAELVCFRPDRSVADEDISSLFLAVTVMAAGAENYSEMEERMRAPALQGKWVCLYTVTRTKGEEDRHFACGETCAKGNNTRCILIKSNQDQEDVAQKAGYVAVKWAPEAI